MSRPVDAQHARDLANDGAAHWYTSSCGRVELALTLDDASSGSHSGQCDDDIAELMRVPYILEQLAYISSDIAQLVATESGRNDYGQGPEDMTDRQANLAFILWMACGDIVESTPQKD